MIFSYYGYEFEIDFDKANSIILSVENKKLLQEMVNDFINNLDKAGENIILYKNNELLKPDKYMYTIYNYFAMDIDKKYLLKYYKTLDEKISYEYLEAFNKLKTDISSYIYKIILNESFDLEYEEITNMDILKASSISLRTQDDILLQLMEVMKFINELLNIEIFILINPEVYFSTLELNEIVKFANYNKFKILLICSELELIKPEKIDKIVVIDKDLCELF